MIKKIEIQNHFKQSELQRRLKEVQLKGFPNIKIYKDANIQIKNITPEEIEKNLFVPQPTVYSVGFLDRIDELANLFSAKGIDIFKLNGGVDYTAYSDEETTDWTIIPPVIERAQINFTNKHLNYNLHLSNEVRGYMERTNCDLNPELANLSYPEYPNSGSHPIDIVCDGSHRIQSGIEKKISQNIILIASSKSGFPYYAAPKPYSEVHIENKRPPEGGNDKTHILKSPAHKSLYRLFPTGGILNGTVRPE